MWLYVLVLVVLSAVMAGVLQYVFKKWRFRRLLEQVGRVRNWCPGRRPGS